VNFMIKYLGGHAENHDTLPAQCLLWSHDWILALGTVSGSGRMIRISTLDGRTVTAISPGSVENHQLR
jgi:hypothetical protein